MKKKLFIEGMSCQNCVMHVAHALKELKGVVSVKVDLECQCAEVELSNTIEEETFKEAIYDAGYDLVNVEDM